GDHEKALEYCKNGLAICKEIKVPTWRPSTVIAETYLDTGNLVRAKHTLEEAGLLDRQNQKGSQSEELPKESAYNSLWGRFYLLKSEYPKAKEYYGKILKSAEENRNANNLFTAYTGLGVACEGLKDDTGAAEYYEKAVKHTEDLRSSLLPAEREKFFDVKINGFFRTAPYEGLARVYLRLNRPQEAFKSTEYTRARVFSEA